MGSGPHVVVVALGTDQLRDDCARHAAGATTITERAVVAALVVVVVVVVVVVMTFYVAQLDIYFAAPLSLFEKLLVAVVAEHALLATKLAVQLTFPRVRRRLISSSFSVD